MDPLNFEFVLFAPAVIDYDYIMGPIARFSQQTPGKQKMSREQLVGLIQSDAKFMDEREDIGAYIATLKAGEDLSETISSAPAPGLTDKSVPPLNEAALRLRCR